MDAERETHLDNLILAIGDWKKFTILQFVVLVITTFPIAYQLFSNVFIGSPVPYRCAKPVNESDLTNNLAAFDDNFTISYGKCHILVSLSTNDTVLKRETCLYGMHYDLPKDTSFISQYDLVCEYSSLIGLSQMLIIAGQGFGAVMGTMVSDLLGRKPIIYAGNIGMFTFGLAIAFAPNYTAFAAFKFFMGACQQALVTNNLTLLLETLSIKRRRNQAWLTGFVWASAVMSLALWAFLFRNVSWRMLQMALSLTSLAALLQFWYVRESLRWLIANNKTKKVIEYIRHATKVNKTSCQNALQIYEDLCHEHGNRLVPDKPVVKVTSKKLTLLHLLKVKRLFGSSVIIGFGWVITALSFFALYLTATSLAGNPYLNFFLTALMEIPSNIYLFFALNRLGRKLTLILAFVMVSVGLIASGIFRSQEPTHVTSTFALISALLAMIGASASFSTLFVYTPELFPTNMRGQAVGVASLLGRVGGMVAPFTGILSKKAKWAPGVLIGSCACLVGLLLMFLPETKGRELAQTIEDLEAWHKKKPNKSDKEMTDFK